ncbi:mitotic-spindle organizing protein 2B-like [Littorina saxatilis]|uniref:Uncharacterized protein n=1 Tax=Littorina saxatilis TaxID=31220 RepID=A0AAN9FY25_9CAEN
MLGREKSEVLRFQIRSKDVLAPDESELYELTQLAGVTMDPSVFKIILDLLKVNVDPRAIMQMLKLMCDPKQQKAAADGHSLSFPSISADSLSTSASSLHNRSSRQRVDSKGRYVSSSSRLKDGRH